MSAQLRDAIPSDAHRTGDILQDFIEQTSWMPTLHKRHETHGFCTMMIDRGWVTVAEINGQVEGFLAQDAETVHALYVDETSRGQHVGLHLLRDAQMRANALELWTFQANTGAQRFYLREGFQEVERTDGLGNDEKLPDIRYRWERGSA